LSEKAIGACTNPVHCAPAWLKVEPPWVLEGMAGQHVDGTSALSLGELVGMDMGMLADRLASCRSVLSWSLCDASSTSVLLARCTAALWLALNRLLNS
jgi:hypothetical protein